MALRVGIIGAGANTRSKHIPLFREIEGVFIQMVANRSPESSRAAAAELGIPHVADTWQELVASPEIDAVCIGTWPYTHAEMAIAALANGKHVLCEARMAMNATEAMLMVEQAKAAKPSGLVAQIVPSPLTLRWDKTIADMIGAGTLGDILAISVKGNGRSFVDPSAPMHWRMDQSLSGHNIMMMGIFYEALMRWVGEAKSVMAMGQVNVKEREGRQVEVPDHLDIIAQMQCGAQAHMQFSSVTGLAENPMEFWVYGSQGTLHLDITSGVLRVGRPGGELEVVEVKEEDAAAWRVEQEFVGAIRGTEEVKLTDFRTGLKYMAFTDAVYTSIQKKKAVQLYGLGEESVVSGHHHSTDSMRLSVHESRGAE